MIDFRLDARGVLEIARDYGAAAKDVPRIAARALNHTGAKANTQVKRTLRSETGLKAGDVSKALRQERASLARLEYAIVGRGGPHPLKAFGARQTAKGVSAKPWNRRRLFAGAFIVGSLGGHAFVRTGRARLPIEKMWGPSIPREMIRGESLAALERVAGTELADRILHEVARALGR